MKKWTRENQKTVLSAHVFRYETIESQNHDGTKRGTFDVVRCANWVNVVALDSDENVILVKQYRHGIDEITLETPAGAIERGEDPLVAAQRELQEETGHTSSEWEKLGEVDVNPAFMTNKCFFYLARNCKKTHELNLDELEEVEVEKITINELKAYLKSGKITHSLAVSSFHHYLLTC